MTIAANGQPTFRYNDFRKILDDNRYKANMGDKDMGDSGKGQ